MPKSPIRMFPSDLRFLCETSVPKMEIGIGKVAGTMPEGFDEENWRRANSSREIKDAHAVETTRVFGCCAPCVRGTFFTAEAISEQRRAL